MHDHYVVFPVMFISRTVLTALIIYMIFGRRSIQLLYHACSPLGKTIDKVSNTSHYYSTIAPFYHIWSRERAKYETVIHCSVPV